MSLWIPVVTCLAGLACGALFLWFWMRILNSQKNSEISLLRQQNDLLAHTNREKQAELSRERERQNKMQNTITELEKKLSASEANREQEHTRSKEKIQTLEQAEANLLNTFKALSADALRSNNEAFLKLALK